MVQTPVKPVALKTFLNLPEIKPASEYVDGRIVQKPMPQAKHSRLQDKFVKVIMQQLNLSVWPVRFQELRCTFDGSSIVPDIASSLMGSNVSAALMAWSKISIRSMPVMTTEVGKFSA